MSKGSGRRPKIISDEEMQERWDRAFGRTPPPKEEDRDEAAEHKLDLDYEDACYVELGYSMPDPMPLADRKNRLEEVIATVKRCGLDAPVLEAHARKDDGCTEYAVVHTKGCERINACDCPLKET